VLRRFLRRWASKTRWRAISAGQLEEHYDAALDAFSRIFKLDEYRTEGETRAAEAMAAPPPDAGTRRALRKLVDKWDAEAGDGDDGGSAPSRSIRLQTAEPRSATGGALFCRCRNVPGPSYTVGTEGPQEPEGSRPGYLQGSQRRQTRVVHAPPRR
jgi:hypothetical protein